MIDIEIKVNRFGPLNNITLHWAPFMVLTGHSNLGKSYANYLIYYVMSGLLTDRFDEILKQKLPEVNDQIEAELTLLEIEKHLNSGVQDYMRSFLGDDFLICDVEYKLKSPVEVFHYEIKKTIENDTLPDMPQGIIYSLKFNGELSGFTPKNFDVAILWFCIKTASVFFESIGDFYRAILLPPGRGAFVGLNYSTRLNTSSSVGMYDNYFRDYDFSQTTAISDKIDDEINKLIANFVGGEFLTEKSKQYILLSTGEKISLTAAASSIKEISPLLLCFLNKSGLAFSYCLEEPEAHLHPCSQIKIADLIACFLNRGNMFHITTHSDYFLQRINQLIKLGDIRRLNEETFEKLCDERGLLKSSYIDRSKVKAYFFHKNAEGKVEVEDMPLTQGGISYKTFYDITRDLNEREEYINEQLYKLNEK